MFTALRKQLSRYRALLCTKDIPIKALVSTLVKSALNMRGYFRDPESTKKAFTPDGYLKTGDLGYIDENKNLIITGRCKDNIQLSNGNKVSVTDIDAYYQKVSGDMRVASCGVPDERPGTEHIVLFLETGSAPTDEITRTVSAIRRLSDSNNSSYHLADIIPIEELPQTTLGKIQRFKLQKIAVQSEKTTVSSRSQLPSAASTIPCSEGVCSIIQKYVPPDIQVTEDMRLSEDLNIDSITMFEICSELQTVYETDFMERLSDAVTVKDLAEIIHADSGRSSPPTVKNKIDIRRYPLKRTSFDRRMVNVFMELSQKIYDMEITGTEYLSWNKQYIFCPNHESHLDGLWTMAAVKDHVNCRNIACLAKQEHLDHALSRSLIRMLGGIPIDRSGNPAPALEQAIHAQIALETGLPLVPVCIIGAYEIYPAQRLLPKFYDISGHRRFPLKLIFGAPIFPQKDDDAETLTEKLQCAVQSLRAENQEVDT